MNHIAIFYLNVLVNKIVLLNLKCNRCIFVSFVIVRGISFIITHRLSVGFKSKMFSQFFNDCNPLIFEPLMFKMAYSFIQLLVQTTWYSPSPEHFENGFINVRIICLLLRCRCYILHNQNFGGGSLTLNLSNHAFF